MWDCEAFTEMLVAYLPQSEGIPVSCHHHPDVLDNRDNHDQVDDDNGNTQNYVKLIIV